MMGPDHRPMAAPCGPETMARVLSNRGGPVAEGSVEHAGLGEGGGKIIGEEVKSHNHNHHMWHQVCIWLEMVGVTCAGSAAFLGAFLMLSYASLISDKLPG